MSKEKKQLSLIERWELDIESYKNGATQILTCTPQCEKCRYFIKGNALHCEIYDNDNKPKYVLFPSKECPRYESIELIEVEINNQYDSKMFGGLFGFCVGDALGVPVEFSTRDERKIDPIKEMRAYGTYHQPFGTWSDDTSLTRVLPLAYYAKDMLPIKRIEIVEEVSSLTHSHKRSKFACIFYIEFVINLLHVDKKDEAYKKTIEFVKKYCTESYYEEIDNYRRILDGTITSYNEE